MCRYEEVTSTTDGMQDIMCMDADEGEEEILKIIELKPVWPKSRDIREYFVCGTR